MSNTHLEVTPLDATFGATVRGVQLAGADEEAIEEIHQLWLEHALLIFPGQHLDRDQQNEFARHFGELEFPAAPLSNLDKEGRLRPDDGSDDMVKILRGNMGWHMDSTYMAVQAKGAVFTAHVVPKVGGETGWADARDGYDTLDAATRDQIADLCAHHSLYHSQALIGDVREGESAGYGFFGQDPPLRPLVKHHPDTGRAALVVGRHAYGIPGMGEQESEDLLRRLVEHTCREPRVHHHRWEPGDAVLWDNRCLLHRATPWDMSEPRVMFHTRIAGDPETELAAAA
jgi:alpha-ketoglutarate-dependent taurine dioxygenase